MAEIQKNTTIDQITQDDTSDNELEIEGNKGGYDLAIRIGTGGFKFNGGDALASESSRTFTSADGWIPVAVQQGHNLKFQAGSSGDDFTYIMQNK